MNRYKGERSWLDRGRWRVGFAAAEMLRREGYDGPVTIISTDSSPPCDRPNLSKDYLAGSAQDDWIPLRPPEFYADQRIELVLGKRVTEIDVAERRVLLEPRDLATASPQGPSRSDGYS